MSDSKSNATTRAHVASPTAASHIPADDFEIPQTSSLSTPDLSDADSAIAIAFTPRAPILSRKEKRQQKKTKHDSAISSPASTDTESPSHKITPPNNPPNKSRQPKSNSHIAIPPSMPAAKNALQTAYPLLICSIGNPGSTYANTLHSAGHIVTSYLAGRKHFTPFQKGLSGNVSRPDTSTMSFAGILSGFRRSDSGPVAVDEDWTLWQSTSLMNVSGRGVQRAYNEWLQGIKRKYGDNAIEGRLVVVHDELESALGKVTVKDGTASARGHNGLKSCQASLGKTKWWRVGVGIGRPESREPDVVAKYVLRKMGQKEKDAVEGSAVGVFNALEQIAAGQR